MSMKLAVFVIVYYYWYLFNGKLQFWPEICDTCHDIMLKAMSFHNIAIVSVKGNGYVIYLVVY